MGPAMTGAEQPGQEQREDVMRGAEQVRHAEAVQRAIQAGQAANSALVASWQRSARLHRLDPTEHRTPLRLGSAELERARQRMEPMLRAAQATLDRLYLAVGGMGCCVLLADKDGIPVERRGAAGDDATFEDWGLWPGTVWSEESEGTNGIGTCLVERRALTIHRQQHFLTRNTLLSCTTAPIFDHEGNLAAALDVSSCREDATEDLVNLVAVAASDAARRIEAEHFRRSYPGSCIVVAPVAEWSSSALLALDKDGLIVGATRAARHAYRHHGDVLGKPIPVEPDTAETRYGEALRLAERGIVERALARCDGNVTAAARQLGVSRATMHRKLSKLGLEHSH